MDCLSENQPTMEYQESLAPGIDFYLVRGCNCGGSGSYGSMERDSGIGVCQ